MSLRADTRAQAIQVGAVLLFAALITAYASYQAFVVPDQNRQVEFNHDKQVQGDLLDLRNAVVSSAGDDSVSVALGARYPSRALLLNPPAPSGSLRTIDTANASRNLTVRNATAVGEAGDYWNGTDQTYATGGFVYEANYAEFDEVPTYYENTVLFSKGRDAAVPLSGQRLVDDEELTLVTFNGSLSVTRTTTTSVDVQAVSVSERTVTVSNDTANVTVAVPTRLSTDRWRALLDGEFTDQGGHVEGLRTRPLGRDVDLLLVDLEPGVDYDLRMAKVGFGTNLRAAERGYILPVDGDGASVPEDGSERLVVEVRDRYNNPVSGVDVNASADQGSIGSVDETDENGQVSLEYSAPPDVASAEVTDTVRVSYEVTQSDIEDFAAPFDASTRENTTLSVTVRDTDSGGGGGSDAFAVNWIEPSGQLDCSGGICTLDGSERRIVDLTMETTPTVQNANVDYAVNDTSVGVLQRRSGTTNATGQNETVLEAQSEGTVNVFTYTGGGGDSIPIEIINFDFPKVAYIENKRLRTLDTDGVVETHSGPDPEIRERSPPADIDGTGGDDIAYVDNNRDLKYVDTGTNDTTTLVSGDAAYSDTLLEVGDATGDGEPEVYYLNESNGNLYRVFLNGTTEPVTFNNGKRVTESYGVVDIVNYDETGGVDIVYVTDKQKLAFIDTGTDKRNKINKGSYEVGRSNGGVAAGEVLSYNGSPRVPIVDSNNNFQVIRSNGDIAQLASSTGDAKRVPVAPRDWDGDGDTEVVFTNGDGKLFYAELDRDSTVQITDENGDPVTPASGIGAR